MSHPTSQHSLSPASGQALPTGRQALTVSQVLQYFAMTLKKPNNYLRIVRRYLEYCIENRSTIDQVSFALYTAGQRPSLISPVRKFVRFADRHQITRVIADPEQDPVPPAANAFDTVVSVRG